MLDGRVCGGVGMVDEGDCCGTEVVEDGGCGGTEMVEDGSCGGLEMVDDGVLDLTTFLLLGICGVVFTGLVGGVTGRGLARR